MRLPFLRKNTVSTTRPYDGYDAVVHIGAPKTGTSAIQYLLLNNRKRLEVEGYYYPEHPIDPNRISGGHSKFGSFLVDGDFEEARCLFELYLDKAKKKGLILLISTEALYPYAIEFKNLVGDKRIKIISFFRNPVDTIYSNYNQTVKRHHNRMPFNEFCKRVISRKSENFSGLVLDKWHQAFDGDNLEVYPYDLDLYNEIGIEGFFLKKLGVKNPSTFHYEREIINASYGPAALELKRLLNWVLDEKDDNYTRRVDRCLQYYSDEHKERPPSLQSMLGCDLYNKLVACFSKSTQQIIKKHLKDVGDDWLKPDYCSQEDELPRCHSRLSLEYVADESFRGDPDLVEHVKGKISSQLVDTLHVAPYAVLKLAEIFRCSLDRYDVVLSCFPPKAVNIFLSEKTEKADLLREIALAYEKSGRLDEALAVIGRARELRPQGTGIIKIQKRLLESLGKDEKGTGNSE